MADRREYYKQYNANRKEQSKQYNAERYQENKEDILNQHKQYRLDNKDKINTHRQEKITCDVCGSSVSRHTLAKHKRTKKGTNHNEE